MITDITERKRAKELSDALNVINSAITSVLDFGEIMQRVVVESAKAIGSEAAVIFLRDGDYWVARYLYGSPHVLAGARLTDEEAKVAALAARMREPVVVNDALHDERVNRKAMEKYNLRSFLNVPLTARGDIVGTLYFSYHSAPVIFTEAQVDFASKLAAAVSIALENARLFEELKRSTDELDKKSKGLQTLLDVAVDITSGLKLDELMHKIARNATELTGADVGAVGLVNEETRAVTYPFIYNLPEYFAKTEVPPGRGMGGVVVSRKEPLTLEDYQTFYDRIPQFAKVGLRSIAMVPLWSRGRIVGLLWVSNLSPEKKLDERAIEILEGIGRHAAIALENARLFEAEQEARRKEKERARKFEILHEITDIAISSLDPEEVAKGIIASLTGRFGLTIAAIWVADKDRKSLLPLASFGYPPGFFDIISSIKIDEQHEASRVFVSGKPVIVEDFNKVSIPRGTKETFERANIKVGSYIILPLKAETELVGVIGFFWQVPRIFTQEDRNFFASITNEIAVGLAKARLFEAEVEAQKKAKYELDISNLLLDAADTLTSSIDLQEVLESLANITLEVTGCRRVLIFINQFDKNKSELTVLATKGASAAPPGTKLKLEQLTPEFRQAVREKRTVVLDYEAPGVSGEARNAIKAYQSRRSLFVPLLLGDELIGEVTIDNPGSGHEFTQREIKLVEGIASQAAVAIENAQLHARTEEELSRTKLLQEVAIAATANPELHVVANEMLKALSKHLRLKMGAIQLLDKEKKTLKVLASIGYPEAIVKQVQELPVNKSDFLSTEAIRGKRILTHNDELLTPERIELLKKYGMENSRYITAPIDYRGETVGVFALSFEGKRDFTQDELDLFHAVTHTIGQAIENARLYEAERHIADTLQSSLLAVPEHIEGIEFDYLYRSAGDTARVGGDFYDLFEIEHEKVGIVIGDVSGKGVEAATLTALVRNTIKAHAMEGGTPARIIAKTNDLVVKFSPANIFVTLFFGILDIASGKLAYCSAGHPPAIIKRATGNIDLLEKHSPIIGAFSGLHYQSGKAMLKKGDILFLYTDGIIEARCDSGWFGEDRLVDLIKKLEPTSTKHMPQAIIDGVVGCAGGKLSDDVAILAVSLKSKLDG